MNDRCHRPKAHNYKWYGAKGIYVCDEWRGRGGFLAFKAWALETGYSPDVQLDRIDSNGPYSPDNCQWLTPRENIKKMWLSREKPSKASRPEVLADLADQLRMEAAIEGISYSEMLNVAVRFFLSRREERVGSGMGGDEE